MRRPALLASLLVLPLLATPGAALVTTPTFATYAAPSTLPFADEAGEPSLGVAWRTGAALFQAYADTYRVTFNDATSPPTAAWRDVSSPYAVPNMDPILATDHATGRTWAGGLVGGCTLLSFTDDDGATWTPSTGACGGPGAYHPTVGGPAPYHCVHTAAGPRCMRSPDGGVTFGPGVPVTCGYTDPGLHGSVHVAPDGVAYLPFRTCGLVNGVAVSMNDGLTWAPRPIPFATAPAHGFDPDVASTPSGRAWVAYPTAGWGVGVARTDDAGALWQGFGDVAAAAGIRSAVFHEMVAGDDTRAAAVYLGSTTDGDPHAPTFAGAWYAYVSVTFDGGTTWTTTKASPNLIQKGRICADGAPCASGRNLLDFIDAQVDARGRILVAVADGCTGACETGSGPSTARHATLLRQTGGTTLFSAYD